MSKVWSVASLTADGYGFDRALGALFCGAKQGQTVSQMAGYAQVAGKAWGCLLCRLLAIIVQPNHCTLAITEGDGPTAQPAAIRAGILLLLMAVILSGLTALPWVVLAGMSHRLL